MEGEVESIEEVSGTLLPCHVCGRTFVLPSLRKHQKICEKNAAKKRKPFNSLKQRVNGTDIAQFHQETYLKKPEPVPEVKKKKTWKEKHFELLRSIRAAKEVKDDMPVSKSSSLLADTERCPSCDRQFGPKAYDRHVEWCKEKKANERLHQSPANVVLAKERLEARIKYVPPLNKNKKTPVKEKYSSPTISTRTESTSSLVSQPSIRAKNKSSFLAKNKEKPAVKKVERRGSNMESEGRNRETSIGASTSSLAESVKSSRKKNLLPRPKLNNPKINQEISSLTVASIKSHNSSEVKNMTTWRDVKNQGVKSCVNLTPSPKIEKKKLPGQNNLVNVKNKVQNQQNKEHPKKNLRVNSKLKSVSDILQDSNSTTAIEPKFGIEVKIKPKLKEFRPKFTNKISEYDPALKLESKTPSKPESDPPLKPESDANLKSESDANLKSESDANLKSESDANLKSESDPSLEPESDPFSKSDRNLKKEDGIETDMKECERLADSNSSLKALLTDFEKNYQDNLDLQDLSLNISQDDSVDLNLKPSIFDIEHVSPHLKNNDVESIDNDLKELKIIKNVTDNDELLKGAEGNKNSVIRLPKLKTFLITTKNGQTLNKYTDLKSCSAGLLIEKPSVSNKIKDTVQVYEVNHKNIVGACENGYIETNFKESEKDIDTKEIIIIENKELSDETEDSKKYPNDDKIIVSAEKTLKPNEKNFRNDTKEYAEKSVSKEREEKIFDLKEKNSGKATKESEVKNNKEIGEGTDVSCIFSSSKVSEIIGESDFDVVSAGRSKSENLPHEKSLSLPSVKIKNKSPEFWSLKKKSVKLPVDNSCSANLITKYSPLNFEIPLKRPYSEYIGEMEKFKDLFKETSSQNQLSSNISLWASKTSIKTVLPNISSVSTIYKAPHMTSSSETSECLYKYAQDKKFCVFPYDKLDNLEVSSNSTVKKSDSALNLIANYSQNTLMSLPSKSEDSLERDNSNNEFLKMISNDSNNEIKFDYVDYTVPKKKLKLTNDEDNKVKRNQKSKYSYKNKFEKDLLLPDINKNEGDAQCCFYEETQKLKIKTSDKCVQNESYELKLPSLVMQEKSIQVNFFEKIPKMFTRYFNRSRYILRSSGCSSSAPIDPYTLAQMQLMELLNCDDFRSISPKNDTNLPPVDRISTPLPIDTIKHSVESLNDEFELMESLIEDNFKIDSSVNGKVCNDNISPIDPSLINENDNLSLPENFKLDDSPTSTLNSNFTTVALQKPKPKQEKNIKPKVTNNSNTTNNSKIATKNKSNNFERGSTVRASLQRKPSVESKVKNRKTLTRTISSVSSNKSFGSEKEKSPVPHNSVKNRKNSRTPTLDEESKTIDDWFNQNNHKEEHCFKPEDLFTVDDAMYEEFKKYEELYLKERRQKSSNRRNKTKLIEINYKILAPEDQVGTNNKVSSDSAYGSLTRSTPDRSVKSLNLSLMESNLTDNHPAIDECRSSLTPSPKNQNFAKFCHECGNKYPVVTAKFCIECGVRRLIL